jgi:hypothetical protein
MMALAAKAGLDVKRAGARGRLNLNLSDPTWHFDVPKTVIVCARMGNPQLRNLHAGNLPAQQLDDLINVSRHDVLRRTTRLRPEATMGFRLSPVLGRRKKNASIHRKEAVLGGRAMQSP